jgi:hypothetical protein
LGTLKRSDSGGLRPLYLPGQFVPESIHSALPIRLGVDLALDLPQIVFGAPHRFTRLLESRFRGSE